MTIQHVITSLHTGGAEKLLLDSIPFYKKLGLEVDLLLLNGADSIFLNTLKDMDICHVYSLGKGIVYNPLFIFKIIPFFKKYDIIHSHLFPTLYWVALAKCLSMSSCKLMYTEHSTHNKRRNKLYLKLPEKIIYNQYKKIIAISDHTKINLLQWIGYQNEKKIEVIENGIDTSLYSQALPYNRESLSLPSDAKIILMTARFTIHKDHNTLIRAFSKLTDKNTYLLLIGDGPLKERSENLAVQLNLENRILFLGIRSDVPELIKMADICVLSSNWEGFGLVAVEYMAAARPVIASNVEGLRNVVNDAGILFEKGNIEDLKNKIEYLLSNSSYYREVSTKCYNRSLIFGIDKMVNSYIKTYKEVLNGK
ncbi:MAG: glycosyltransferase [Prevotella sp.]|jgi:glycosyltransferase involved in cell wall biosynthesis|nr:glycosyltransferase [Prevotella sp.]